MRIRCSKGLRINAFYGHFFIRSTDLLALPACDADKARQGDGGGGDRSSLARCARDNPQRPPLCHSITLTPPPSLPAQAFAVEIVHEETVVTGAVAYVQSALLYTNSQGERRIRVHTLAVPVVSGEGGGGCCIHPTCRAGLPAAASPLCCPSFRRDGAVPRVGRGRHRRAAG